MLLIEVSHEGRRELSPSSCPLCLHKSTNTHNTYINFFLKKHAFSEKKKKEKKKKTQAFEALIVNGIKASASLLVEMQ